MASRKPTTARSIAAETLCSVQLRHEFAGETLKRFPQLTERQRATDIVFGVIRNRILIDLVIERFSSSPIKRISDRILNILRVAIFELVYCPQTVEYAIVDEAVEYTKHVASAKQAGFVNAVLRQTLRHILSRQKPIDNSHPRKTVPQTQHMGCEFSIEILTDGDAMPSDYLSIAFSLPRWLVERWLAEYGVEQTRQICFASNRRPSIYLRPNTLKTTVEELFEKLRCEGIHCEIVAEMNMIKLESPGAISNLPGFSEGLFTVQDISAAMAVRTMQPQPGSSILDLCSAPGTKTTQLAELTGGKAKVVATDIDSRRLEKVKDNISRLGLAGSVTAIEYHILDEYIKKQDGFNCVLLDVPCSNTGVLAKRPEVRYRLTENAVTALAQAQLDLLRRAKELLKSGGLIAYSTCSIQPEENDFLVKRFLEEHTGFKLVAEKLMLPSAEGFDHDGAYVAVLTNEVRDIIQAGDL